MGLKVGELFVDMGIEGSEKTLGAITGIRSGLQSTSNFAFETKAALLGAMYAVQQLFASSNRTGTELSNFNSLLGVSAQTLQRYQYAARQVGVSNQEMEGTFKNIQSTMTKALMGEGVPKGLARVSMLTGGMTPEDLKRFTEKPQELIQKLQEYALKETNAGLRNEVLKSFGISDGVAAAMARNAFRPDVLSRAPVYSDNEIKSLDKANAAWGNLGNKIEMAIGKFNAKHGVDLVKNIDMIADKVLKLADSFMKLADKLKIFELIGDVFKGWGMIFDEINKSLDEQAAKTGKPTPGLGDLGKSLDTIEVKPGRSLSEEFNFAVDMFKSGKWKEMFGGKNFTIAPEMSGRALAPSLSAPRSAGGGTTNQTINVNQTQHFNHDGTDPGKAKSSQNQAVRDAYRQMPAQAQGN